MKCKIEKGFIFYIVFFHLGNILFAQTRTLIWKDSDKRKGQKFPFAYINNLTSTEKEINAYLEQKYLNQSDSYRDDFIEYEIIYPKNNICGIAIKYEHEFNTSPGIWSFTDNNYFDLRNGKRIQIKSLIEEGKYDHFIKIVIERRNNFVQGFKKALTKDQDDYERLIEIADYTLNDSIDISDIDKLNTPNAMSGQFEMLLYSDYLELCYYWEYGWGLGRQALPNIILRFTYRELISLLNDYAKEILLISNKKNNK